MNLPDYVWGVNHLRTDNVYGLFPLVESLLGPLSPIHVIRNRRFKQILGSHFLLALVYDSTIDHLRLVTSLYKHCSSLGVLIVTTNAFKSLLGHPDHGPFRYVLHLLDVGLLKSTGSSLDVIQANHTRLVLDATCGILTEILD